MRAPLGIVALVVAAAAGGAAAILLARDARGTPGTVTVASAVAVTVTDVTASRTVVAASTTTHAFDPDRIYRDRVSGVVTIAATVGSDDVSGSGFVASDKGYVVTNAHVITNSPDAKRAGDVRMATDIYVKFQDGNSLPARVVGYDLFDDIGVLAVDPAREALHVLPLGSSGGLRVGDSVAVMGSPFSEDLAGSLSVGVVSALGRSIQPPVVSFTTPGAIQTDAAINHGNSGGPMFDADGLVVGVAAQIESTGGGGEGVGFAIPIEAVQRSLTDLVASGRVRYGWLGVATQPVSEELARQFHLKIDHGLLVDGVTGGGPAAKAGLIAGTRAVKFQDIGDIHPDGDVIVAVDGHPVTQQGDLSVLVVAARPGQKMRLDVVRRNGARAAVTVALGERPPNVSS